MFSSCGLFIKPRQASPGEKFENNYFKIREDSFRYKKQYHLQLTAEINDNNSKTLVRYSFSNICTCSFKNYANTSYKTYLKLTTAPQFDIPLSDTDKLIFKKLTGLPAIEKYCSRSLLDSAKGYNRVRMYTKPFGK